MILFIFYQKISSLWKYIDHLLFTTMYTTFQKAISNLTYRKTCNIRRTLLGNEIVDHSDVVGAALIGAAPTTSSFST